MTSSHAQGDCESAQLEQRPPQPRDLDERTDTQFKYEELEQGRNFRLLWLHASPNLEDPVYCKLQQFGIESAPPYRAVSYVWGDPGTKRVVYVGDPPYQEIEVGDNLYTLLTWVRKDGDSWFWIDALCINQSSRSERNHQVSLMGLIYSKADTVLGWLGPHDVKMRRAFYFISAAACYSLRDYCEHWHGRGGLAQLDSTPKSVFMEISHYDWSCFIHFANNLYWKRRWIIQEVVLAKNVVFLAGRHKLPIDDVERFFEGFTGVPYPVVPYTGWSEEEFEKLKLQWKDLMKDLLSLSEWSSEQLGHVSSDATATFPYLPVACLARHRQGNKPRSDSPSKLLELMQRYDLSECKEPSDNVYALYNLLGEHRRFLHIDYTQTPLDRCISVLRYFRDYEDMTESDTIGYAGFLYRRLCRGVNAQNIHDTTSEELSREPSFKAYLFDLGDAIIDSDGPKRFRKLTRPLRVMPKYLLHGYRSRWILSTPVGHSREDVIPGKDVIGPNDLVFFLVSFDEQDIQGLETCSIEAGDRIWHAKTMNLAFVMRPKPSPGLLIIELVGRAVILPHINHRDMLDRAEDSVARSWREDGVGEWREPMHAVDLSPIELLDLAFWADNIGAESSPFSG